MDTTEHKGLTFRVEHEWDTDHGAPWEANDGHGPVRECYHAGYSYPPKKPGERVLSGDRGWSYLYDAAEAVKIAKRDGWGLSDKHRAELAAKLGREPTAGEVTAAAVERDFEFLRRWATNQWHYVGVVVTLLDVDGGETHMSESLWGIEDDADEYLESVAAELAESIARTVGDDDTVTIQSRGHTTTYTIRELEEA